MDKRALLTKKSVLTKRLRLVGLPLNEKLKLKNAAKMLAALIHKRD